MNKKSLLLITPILMFGLTGCKSSPSAQIDKINAKCEKKFEVGDTLIKSDIIVNAIYKDQSSVTINENDWKSDFSFPYVFTSEDLVSGKTINIQYNEFKTSLKIDLYAPIHELKASLKDSSKTFEVGDQITKDDIKVIAIYSYVEKEINDFTTDIPLPYTFVVDDYKNDKNIEISYQDKKTNLKISVNNHVTKISVSLRKEKTYLVGEKITSSDIKVVATYKHYEEEVSDTLWTSDILLPYTFTLEDALKRTKTFKIEYNLQKADLIVNVNAPITGIKTTLREVKGYTVGDSLTKDNIKVVTIRETGEEEITDYSIDVNLPYTFVENDVGIKTFKITYLDFKDTLNVAVYSKKKEGEVTSEQWTSAMNYILNSNKTSKYTILSSEYPYDSGGFKVDCDKHQYVKDGKTIYQKYLYKTYIDHEKGEDKKSILDDGIPPKNIDNLYTWLKYYINWYNDAKFVESDHAYVVTKTFDKYEHQSSFMFDESGNLFYAHIHCIETQSKKVVLDNTYGIFEHNSTNIVECPSFDDILLMELESDKTTFKEKVIANLDKEEVKIIAFDTKELQGLTSFNHLVIDIQGVFSQSSDLDVYNVRLNGVGLLDTIDYEHVKEDNCIKMIFRNEQVKTGDCIIFNLSDSLLPHTELKIHGTIKGL